MELGTSNDGIGTALNIFGVTLLALLDPAEAIRAFLENLKGSGSQELCEKADSWEGSDYCSQLNFSPAESNQAADQLLRPQQGEDASVVPNLGAAIQPGAFQQRSGAPWLEPVQPASQSWLQEPSTSIF